MQSRQTHGYCSQSLHAKKVIVCTLGVSPSLVSRWREGYSLWRS